MAKRPDGALEQDVLRVLWAATGPLLPTQVRDLVPTDLAYTSVATVLTRLHDKGLLNRTAVGRAFAYSPAIDESQLAARQIGDVLARSADRHAALVGLVSNLTGSDRDSLRALLNRSGQ